MTEIESSANYWIHELLVVWLHYSCNYWIHELLLVWLHYSCNYWIHELLLVWLLYSCNYWIHELLVVWLHYSWFIFDILNARVIILYILNLWRFICLEIEHLNIQRKNIKGYHLVTAYIKNNYAPIP